MLVVGIHVKERQPGRFSYRHCKHPHKRRRRRISIFPRSGSQTASGLSISDPRLWVLIESIARRTSRKAPTFKVSNILFRIIEIGNTASQCFPFTSCEHPDKTKEWTRCMIRSILQLLADSLAFNMA